jgi:hypothetical protein
MVKSSLIVYFYVANYMNVYEEVFRIVHGGAAIVSRLEWDSVFRSAIFLKNGFCWWSKQGVFWGGGGWAGFSIVEFYEDFV